MFNALILLAILTVDRLVKVIVNLNMDPGDSIRILGNIFSITYVRNTGAAFSILEGHHLLLTMIPAAVILAGIVFAIAARNTCDEILLLAITFICAGGLGNLIDRVFMGYVVDMFDFGRFPVFNIADIFVCLGCGLMILFILVIDRGKSSDGSRKNRN